MSWRTCLSTLESKAAKHGSKKKETRKEKKRGPSGRGGREGVLPPSLLPKLQTSWWYGQGSLFPPPPSSPPRPFPTHPPTTTSITSLNLANSSSVFCQSVLTTDPLPSNFTVSTHLNRRSLNASDYGWVSRRDPTLPSIFLFPPSSCSVNRRMVHTLQQKGDESFLVFKCLAFHSFADPVLITGPFSSQLVPDAPSIVPAPLMFPPCVVVRVLFHFECSVRGALLAKVPNSSLEPIHMEDEVKDQEDEVGDGRD